ncbi:hypothetical protein E2C01_029278 [Portunus trituberculatus]|uniref:Uncharacterized protein n=1 Tax=Portunus trituberculatus TaxID=210409 RepID=A0A5B7EML1_PORTR|nr:hypothetical protein [Portunus trituberculatus]
MTSGQFIRATRDRRGWNSMVAHVLEVMAQRASVNHHIPHHHQEHTYILPVVENADDPVEQHVHQVVPEWLQAVKQVVQTEDTRVILNSGRAKRHPAHPSFLHHSPASRLLLRKGSLEILYCTSSLPLPPLLRPAIRRANHFRQQPQYIDNPARRNLCVSRALRLPPLPSPAGPHPSPK